MTDSAKNSNEGPQSAVATTTRPQPPKARQLPPYKVILHNDDKNDMLHVIESIVMLTSIPTQEALLKMTEAHQTGSALLLVTHKERAELYAEQFASRSLTVTIEPDE